MGNRMMAIQRKSYFKPSQNAGNRSNTPVDGGLKHTTVAMRKAVNMHRYIRNSFTIHCIVLGTRQLISILFFPLARTKKAKILKLGIESLMTQINTDFRCNKYYCFFLLFSNKYFAVS